MTSKKSSGIFISVYCAVVLAGLCGTCTIGAFAAQGTQSALRADEVTQSVRPLLRHLSPPQAGTGPAGAGVILAYTTSEGKLQSYVLHLQGQDFEVYGPYAFLPVFFGDSLEFVYRFALEKIDRTLGPEARLKSGSDTLLEISRLSRIFLSPDVQQARRRGNQTVNQQNFEGVAHATARKNHVVWESYCDVYLKTLSANVLTMESQYLGYMGTPQPFREEGEFSLALSSVLSDSVSFCQEYFNPELLSLEAPRKLGLVDFVDSARLGAIELELQADLTQRCTQGVEVSNVVGVGRLALAFDAGMYPAQERARVADCMRPINRQVEIMGCRTARWLGRTYAIAQTFVDVPHACNHGRPFVFESLIGAIGDQSSPANMPLAPGSLIAAGVDDVALSPEHALAAFRYPAGFLAFDVASGRLLWRKALDAPLVMAEGVSGDNMKRLLSVLAVD